MTPFFPQLLKPIDFHRHIAKAWVGQDNAALRNAFYDYEVIETFRPYRGYERTSSALQGLPWTLR